jgi:hypothetical protein
MLAGVLAPTAAGGTASATTDSAASDWGSAGVNCTGIEVVRCAYVEIDGATSRIRAGATIRDVRGRANYEVAVNNTQLQRYVDGRWVYVRRSLRADYDGW